MTRMLRTPGALFLALLGTSACHPGPPPKARVRPPGVGDRAAPARRAAPRPKPRAVRRGKHACVTLTPLKKRWFLGENIQAHYRVKNCGTLPFKVDFGGDYRGASRHLRFKVLASDARGRKLADPDPSGFCMGGMSSDRVLKPGDSFYQTLPLVPYARFERAGTYRVRLFHDLGWKPSLRRAKGRTALPPFTDSRWTQATLVLVQPSPAQARQVVARMAKLPTDPNATWGKKSGPFADFVCLRYPVYLPILEQRVIQGLGVSQALRGIANIPTPAATAALIRLLRLPGGRLSQPVVGALSMRLPDPMLQGKLGPRNPFFNTLKPQRLYLIKHGWRPRFAGAVRAAARRLLAAKSTAAVRSGAFLVQAVGTAKERAALVSALDWAIAQTVRLPLNRRLYPRPRGACQELLRAAVMLVRHGRVKPPTPPRTPGQIALYLTAWGPVQAAKRPRSFNRLVGQWMSHRIPYIRELVLTLTTGAYPASVLRRLRRQLTSSSVDLQVAACNAVARTKQPRFRRALLALMATARERWLIIVLAGAARAIGVRPDRVARAWALRLDDPKLTMLIFGQLSSLFQGNSGTSMSRKITLAEARRLKRRWLRFIRTHRVAIRKGHRFRFGDPRLSPQLVPRGFYFTRRAKPRWPPAVSKARPRQP